MDVIVSQLPRFIDATWLTIWMFAVVTFVSTILGASLAILANAAGRGAGIPLAVYTWVFRGLPELVVLLFCYLALPTLGLDLGSIGSALLAFTLVGTAFQAEIFKAGLSAVDPRMIEAARALGMSWQLRLRRVVLPQVFRIVVPPWATFLAGNIKAFALASAVAVTEIMFVTRQSLAISRDPFTLILFAGVIYGAIASALMLLELVLTRHIIRRYGPLNAT